jgi:hypothetical protein
MNKTFIFTSTIILAVAIFFASNVLPAQSANVNATSTSGMNIENAQSILASTLQIIIFSVDAADSDQEVYERGIASLVEINDQIVLVSHDHWNFVEDAPKVEFRDVEGKLLAEINGNDFRSLIIYRDEGTMLLSQPVVLTAAYQSLMASRSNGKAASQLNPGQMGDPQSLKVGDSVTVAYRIGENRSQVSVLAATVIEVGELNGVASFRLQSLDGTVLQNGDSGGGVWLDGKLVGNMWLSEKANDYRIWIWKSTQPATKFVDTSVAAQLPTGIENALPQLSALVEVEEADEALEDW